MQNCFFLPGCELVFKTLSTDGRDYHSEMNSVIFNKWVEEQLAPALPPKSLVVMDNAFYHSVIKEGTKAPTSATTYKKVGYAKVAQRQTNSFWW